MMARLIGSPTVAASGDGRLELFVSDIGGTLWHSWQTAWSNGWSGWVQAGQTSSWPVSLAASGDGRLELFGTGTGSLQHSWQTTWSNGWSAWENIPAPPSPVGAGFFAPGVAARANGRLAAFVANGALWRREQTAWSNGWTDWLPHGSPPGALVVGPVTAHRSGDGRVEVFTVDDHGRMWNIRQTSPDSGFSEWNDFGTPDVALEDRPALARSADGRLELFVTGSDGALYHQWETAVGTLTWSGWVLAGKPPNTSFVDHPVLGASADGRLELFVTGADRNIWHSWQTRASNGWSGWVSTLPGPGTEGASPDVRASGDGRLELFVVGADGNLWHRWQTQASNGWSAWVAVAHP